MKITFPKIINEVITSATIGKLKTFHYQSLEDALECIDRSMEFFTAHVHTDWLDDDIKRDERFVDKQEFHPGTPLEQKTQYYWLKHQDEHFERIDARMAEWRRKPEYQHIPDNDYSALSRLKDKVINELNLEIQPQIIEFLKQEYQHMYKDQWEKHWNDEDFFKERIEYRYYRKYEMPNPFKYWDDRNTWQQFYFAKDSQGDFYYQRGGSGSSDQRFCHCIYGHLYAVINEEKPLQTYFFKYDSRNRFLLERKEKSLWLNFHDLMTNCYIRESDEILKNVHKIERTW